MSINFHAYQCRDYLLSGFEEIKKQWEADFTDFNGDRVCTQLGLDRDEAYIYVYYYQDLFRLNLSDGHLEKKLADSSMIEENPLTFEPFEAGWTGNVRFNESMSVYHLLKFSKEFVRQPGNWVPNESLDPRAIGVDKRENILLEEFAAKYAGRIEELEERCQALGGKEVDSKADIAYEFYPFPQTPIRLLFWEQDEEFSAQVQVLVQKNISDYVNIETTGCMASDLMDRIG